jgi:hypothetical protein
MIRILSTQFQKFGRASVGQASWPVARRRRTARQRQAGKPVPPIHGALRLMVCLLLTAIAGWGEARNLLDHPRPGARPSKLWRWSVAALAAGSAADSWSSYGHTELNPLLRGPQGRFSARAIGIKAAIAGGSVATQWLILRKRPETARAAALTNFAMAGIFTGVAARNRSASRFSQRVP